MKNWMYILYIGLLGFLTMACQSSMEEEIQLPPSKVQISFTLALDDLDSRSRAGGDWNENETTTGVIGDNYENQIDLRNGLQVLVYSADGSEYLGKVTNPDVVRKVEENGRKYEFQGDLEVDVQNITNGQLICRLMVFANCSTVKNDNLASLTYAHNADYIPMWGVQTCTLTLVKGETNRVPQTIHLLRAMAKVEVRLSDAMKQANHELSDVMIDNYNKAGYVMPTGYASALVSNTESLMQQGVFNPLPDVEEGSLNFARNNESFYIYIPEYQNVGVNASPASIILEVDNKKYNLEFKDYTNNTPFNIIRNHYYQYTITAVNTIENVLIADLSYQSIPWTDVDNGELSFK